MVRLANPPPPCNQRRRFPDMRNPGGRIEECRNTFKTIGTVPDITNFLLRHLRCGCPALPCPTPAGLLPDCAQGRKRYYCAQRPHGASRHAAHVIHLFIVVYATEYPRCGAGQTPPLSLQSGPSWHRAACRTSWQQSAGRCSIAIWLQCNMATRFVATSSTFEDDRR